MRKNTDLQTRDFMWMTDTAERISIRPDFQRMMADAQAGLIKTIIVKDMSRFGRDYIMVGYYTEIMLPQMDIRFIAVNDNVDSENQADNDFTPFRNIINEWYAKGYE